MEKIVIGIDPGLNGGIAVLKNGRLHKLFTMPTFSVKKGRISKKTKKELEKNFVDGRVLYNTLKDYPGADYFVEDVHSLFNARAEANFSLGHGIGVLSGILRALGYTFYLVQPKEWQKGNWEKTDIVKGEKKTDTKKTSLNAAQRIFPGQTFLKSSRSRVPHDGLFDSALIGNYGYKYLWGKL